MNAYSILPLSAFLGNALVTGLVYQYAQHRQARTIRAFSYFTGMLALWALIIFTCWLHVPEPLLGYLVEVAFCTVLTTGALFTNFVYHFLKKRRDLPFYTILVVVLLSLLIQISTDWFIAGYQQRSWGVSSSPGVIAYPIIFAAIIAPFLYGIVLIAERYRTALDNEIRTQLRILLIGMSVTLLLCLTSDVFLPMFAPDWWGDTDFAVGFTTIFSYSVFRALRRHKFLSVEVTDAALPIFESASDGIVILDDQNALQQINTSARKLLGCGDNPGEHVQQLIEEKKLNLERPQYELQLARGEHTIHLLVSSSSIAAREQRRGTLILLRDITELRVAEASRRQLEEQLQHAQKMEAMGRLASGVAHDFNNMLSAIIGYTTIVKDSIDEADPIFTDLLQIEQASQKAASLTRQLLSFSRKEVVKPELLRLNDVIEEMEPMLHPLIADHVKLRIVLDKDVDHVLIARSQLNQVIMNLVINAQDSITEPSRTLGSSAERRGTVTIQTTIDDEMVSIRVADNGSGIQTDIIDKIFDPFFTTKPKGKGTGLGLSIVYGIVKQAGGNIAVQSEPGTGTCFTVVLPMRHGDKPRIQLDHQSVDLDPASETILVAEDNDAVRALTRRILEVRGYNVIEATNGGEALQLAKQQNHDIDLLLTDVIMPGMRGPDLATELVGLGLTHRVLYMSAYTEEILSGESDVALSEEVRLLQKPFTPLSLLRAVRQVLEESH